MDPKTVSHPLAKIARWRQELSALPPALTEDEAIDRITALEELTAACAAAQARETLTFDMRRRNREADEGMPSSRQGAGVGAEIGLARRVSRSRGSALLGFSRSLILDLPRTYAALKTGIISEEKAQVVAREVDWLPREKRRQVDERMAERLGEVGTRRLGNEVRALAQQLDQTAAVEHLDRCTKERAVTVRPAPGNMAYLTALLPLPQAVAVYANLSRSAQTMIGTGRADGRNRSQLMADLLVERATGQESADAVPTELHLVMSSESLIDSDDASAWLPGFGPLPAGAARTFIAENEATVFLRRLYSRPVDGQLVAMDSRRREFSGLLRRMIVIRDGVCRSPWCDAPISHVDHAVPAVAGGATSWNNASGLCAACNYAKERPGWRHEASSEKLVVTTPTGHRYEVHTGPLITRMPNSDESPPGRCGPQAREGPPGDEGQSGGEGPPGDEAQPGGEIASAKEGPPGDGAPSAVEAHFRAQLMDFLTAA